MNKRKPWDQAAGVDIKVGYPFLKNDETFTKNCFDLAQDFLNDSDVIEINKRMTAEDFSLLHSSYTCFILSSGCWV